MVWQDILIAVMNMMMGYALIPQVYKGFKEKRKNIATQTGFLTFSGIYIMGIAMFTLKLYFTTAVLFFNGTLWLILFIQSLIYKN